MVHCSLIAFKKLVWPCKWMVILKTQGPDTRLIPEQDIWEKVVVEQKTQLDIVTEITVQLQRCLFTYGMLMTRYQDSLYCNRLGEAPF